MNQAEWLKSQIHLSGNRRLWFRTPMGLEQLAAVEISEKLAPVDQLSSHRNVFSQLPVDTDQPIPGVALHVRLADDVYEYWGYCSGLDRSKASVAAIESFLRSVLTEIRSFFGADRYLRPTVSFVGKRNFNRFFVEKKIAEAVQDLTDLKVLSNERKEEQVVGELRLRCHIEDDRAYFGLALRDSPLHRRPWRNIRYNGQLHTPVAAAMARILNPPAHGRVIDPFCGSATILIESAIQYPTVSYQGWDINGKAITIAGQSAEQAKVEIEFTKGDSLRHGPAEPGYYLISNPPWDEKHLISGGDREHFINGLANWIRPSSGSVLLLPEDWILALEKVLDQSFIRTAQTRIRGKLATIIETTPGRSDSY